MSGRRDFQTMSLEPRTTEEVYVGHITDPDNFYVQLARCMESLEEVTSLLMVMLLSSATCKFYGSCTDDLRVSTIATFIRFQLYYSHSISSLSEPIKSRILPEFPFSFIMFKTVSCLLCVAAPRMVCPIGIPMSLFPFLTF